MRKSLFLPLLTFALLLGACDADSEEGVGNTPSIDMLNVSAPLAAVDPTSLEIHGDVRSDPYFWLRDRENPNVIAYLEAENEYTEVATAHTRELENVLYEEMIDRIKQDDASVPYKDNHYWYYSRYEDGADYPIYARKKESLDAVEEIMINANELAEGHEYYAVRGRAVSSSEDILAYAEDTVGRRFYTIRFKNLSSGQLLDDTIADVTGNMAWADDNRTLFYARQDPNTLRSFQILRHELGTDPSNDQLIYEERDDEFSTSVSKTKSKKYILIGSYQTLSSEVRYLASDDPHGDFTVIQPREENHEYSVDHFGDHFYVRTNWQAENFRLMRTPIGSTGKQYWEDVISHREAVFLAGYELFKDHLVITERSGGLIHLRIRPWDGSKEHYLEFGEPAYRAGVSVNRELDSQVLRYSYSSMTTPNSTIDYDMESRERTLLKEEPVLGDFDKTNYVTERVQAPARDGVMIPVSIVYRKGVRLNGTSALLLYGYGSYGATIDASFSSSRLSLLDRGVIYAIAHIRGGQINGREWYEDGKLLNKKNTFTDFIDVAEYLIEEKYADPNHLFAQGGSAGGLLMGAVTNMRPDLWRGVIANVPWVDVVTTMLDDTIPLTTSEYDEWGDPNEEEYYHYMLSYSPYDNVEAKDYPNLLVTTGLHDSQVQYWESAKWVAKIRSMKTDNNLLLLKINMEAGHGGASGRLKRFRDTAFGYSFLLDLAGIHNIEPLSD